MIQINYLTLVVLMYILSIVIAIVGRVKLLSFIWGVTLSILLVLLFYIPWVGWFKSLDVLGWGEAYTTSISIINVPIDEILWMGGVMLFFLVLYEWAARFESIFKKPDNIVKLTGFLALCFFALSIVLVTRIYSFAIFSLLAIFLTWQALIARGKFMAKSIFTFTISLLFLFPFELYRTGFFSKQGMIWYDQQEHLQWTVLSIPVENIAFYFLIFLLLITFYENLKARVLDAELSTS